MIHYHGTPSGGTKIDATRFLSGRHALVSYYAPSDLPVALECCQSIILDNGAFSLWKKRGGDVDFDAYYKWVHQLAGHPALDWCLIPDKIDGTEQQNQDLIYKWLRIGSKVEGVPVWHYHESFEYLEWLINNFRTVSLGSSGEWPTPNSKKWWDRTAEVMNICTDSKGVAKTRLHGLRMLNPKVFSKLPLVSADSTNAAVNSGAVERFGMYPSPNRWQRADIIAERVEAINSSPVWVKPSKNSQVEFSFD